MEAGMVIRCRLGRSWPSRSRDCSYHCHYDSINNRPFEFSVTQKQLQLFEISICAHLLGPTRDIEDVGTYAKILHSL